MRRMDLRALRPAVRSLLRSAPVEDLRDRLRSRGESGEPSVQCPICDHRAARFEPFGGGMIKRPNAQCAKCGALERHRTVWLYMVNETDLFAGNRSRRMLHVAPEPVLERRLRAAPLVDYVSADLAPGVADEVMDITDIQHPDDSFDVIYCSHVLEHIPDDARAMGELRRILRPGGWAILQVPILLERTDEDASITDPEERLRRFAQRDHVRAYGPDYADRLRTAGFEVRQDRYAERIGPQLSHRYGLLTAEVVHLCTKS